METLKMTLLKKLSNDLRIRMQMMNTQWGTHSGALSGAGCRAYVMNDEVCVCLNCFCLHLDGRLKNGSLRSCFQWRYCNRHAIVG
jgi:hypothetical protein